jgi:ribosomal protein L40E
MALQPCRECGTEVSTEAEKCPQCGTPRPTADLKKEKATQTKGALGCLAMFALFFVMIFAMCPGGSDSPSPAAPAHVDLDGAVRFTGTQFVLTNNDDFAWTDCVMAVNGGAFRAGYTLKAPRVEAGETYTVGAMQFAKRDGERFNPATMKPQNFFVDCDTPHGDGFYTGRW